MSKIKYIPAGTRYGRLTVIKHNRTANKRTYFDCVCDCGNKATIRSDGLKGGGTTSCGCYQKEQSAKSVRLAKTTHGEGCDSVEYYTWLRLKGRCFNKNNPKYPRYGGRGTTVVPRWLGINGYANFIYDMGDRPEGGYSIERMDNDGNYSPCNCCWADSLAQARNKSNNRYIEYGGERLTYSEWSRKLGGSINLVEARINRLGWEEVIAVTTPVRRVKNG